MIYLTFYGCIFEQRINLQNFASTSDDHYGVFELQNVEFLENDTLIFVKRIKGKEQLELIQR